MNYQLWTEAWSFSQKFRQRCLFYQSLLLMIVLPVKSDFIVWFYKSMETDICHCVSQYMMLEKLFNSFLSLFINLKGKEYKKTMSPIAIIRIKRVYKGKVSEDCLAYSNALFIISQSHFKTHIRWAPESKTFKLYCSLVGKDDPFLFLENSKLFFFRSCNSHFHI